MRRAVILLALPLLGGCDLAPAPGPWLCPAGPAAAAAPLASRPAARPAPGARPAPTRRGFG